ncbi:MAG: hypothetical protein ACD_34C00435G0001, partial [uncultured bacterium]
ALMERSEFEKQTTSFDYFCLGYQFSNLPVFSSGGWRGFYFGFGNGVF